jgi:hypothetical protein
MILGVLTIGVDFRATDKLKSGFARQLDDKVFTHITITRQWVLRFVGSAAMLLNAQNPAGL